MKIIIAGSRDFDNYALLKSICAPCLLDNGEIVSGGARGADMLGEKLAKELGIKLHRFPADWNTKGKAAGFIRNVEMAKFADMLIAFWDEQSRGTRHMIDQMRILNKPFWIVYYNRPNVNIQKYPPKHD